MKQLPALALMSRSTDHFASGRDDSSPALVHAVQQAVWRRRRLLVRLLARQQAQ